MTDELGNMGWPAGPVAEVAVDPHGVTGRWKPVLQELQQQGRVVVVVRSGWQRRVRRAAGRYGRRRVTLTRRFGLGGW
jgi:hypothetical protein